MVFQPIRIWGVRDDIVLKRAFPRARPFRSLTITPGGEGGEGTPYMKGMGILVVSLRDVNFGFSSRLGCSWQNIIIFSRKGLF